MQVFTGSSGCSLVQKFPEFTRGERNAPAVEDAFIFNKSSDYASQMECGHGRIETRECRILPADAVEDEENPNQMERAEDHCRNNIHTGLLRTTCIGCWMLRSKRMHQETMLKFDAVALNIFI